MAERKHVIFGDDEASQKWVVVYSLTSPEIDDDFETFDNPEIIFSAKNFETAVKYAQQYLRKKQTEEETSVEWAGADILSIEQY